MSKADWGFLERLLEEGQEHSTGVGRVWLTVLFLFRILVLGTAAESAWDDEQSDFICNTAQPGCELGCYDKAFPISHFRVFVLQVIFVSTPTVFYFGYVAFRNRWREKELEEAEVQHLVAGKDRGSSHLAVNVNVKKVTKDHTAILEQPKLKGRLLCAYTLSICIKIVLEVGFMLGIYFLYGFFILPKFECERLPCPHKVDCFVSRPTEKTIFTIYMQVIAGVSLLLNAMELLYVIQRVITLYLERAFRRRDQDLVPSNLDSMSASQCPPSYQERCQLPIPIGDISYSQPYKDCILMENKVNQHQGMDQCSPTGSLPNYLICPPATLTLSSKPDSKRSSRKGDRSSCTKSISQQKHYV
nr:gap junction Cx32.2 protein-like [Paramormyrops kingsleyae]XP_023687936.1 gap junction Cx32.2 protein-like [Paramormyrops kingsleyae]XP_023687937.1 gap junction Cx32.2 protein-like [Paramormyrops kingsleyae]XP_023687938.1 gap junction Cx32.2 protein-like [Paramormyrops kingsleyae]XP_023687939.1 gap junction Cx32.2 protein-like [Paramormyrops kingsleyae]